MELCGTDIMVHTKAKYLEKQANDAQAQLRDIVSLL